MPACRCPKDREPVWAVIRCLRISDNGRYRRRKPVTRPCRKYLKEGQLMAVAVISKTSMRLMPTSGYRARKLLRSKKAVIYGYHPFTIRLTERASGDTQPVELCVDTGYIHIGISVKSGKHDSCRIYRRQRRSRRRYLQPRFDNRKRKNGWIAPSLEHKKEIHI